MTIYRDVFRPLLFKLDSESAHHLMLRVARLAEIGPVRAAIERRYTYADPALATNVCGLKLRNPLMIAAGFDKDCDAFSLLEALGAGAVEVGTITAHPQPGNPRPRIFRFPADRALINRMGFPSIGADVAAATLWRLRQRPLHAVLGVNIGKSKVTPLEDAAQDYLYSFERLRELADYFTINVSSPNTPGVKQLQNRDKLQALLGVLQEKNRGKKPMFIKISPDLTHEQLDEVVETCKQTGIAGIIATNSTTAREGLSVTTTETGGLSGAPLFNVALEKVRYLAAKIPVIGVGGISTTDDVVAMLSAGARAVQIYTALIYEGPSLLYRLKRELAARIKSAETPHLAAFAQSPAGS